MLHEKFLRNPQQIKPLAARQHGHRNAPHFRRAKDEHDVRWRLFQCLEKRVERRLRQHVDLVHDVHLVTPRRRAVVRGIGQFPHVIDAGVTRTVNFQNVQVPFSERLGAGGAFAARAHRRVTAAQAIQAAGNDACSGGLADATHADKEECVRDPPLLERVGQRADQHFLAEQVLECRRTVLPRQHQVRRLTGIRSLLLICRRRALGLRIASCAKLQQAASFCHANLSFRPAPGLFRLYRTQWVRHAVGAAANGGLRLRRHTLPIAPDACMPPSFK